MPAQGHKVGEGTKPPAKLDLTRPLRPTDPGPNKPWRLTTPNLCPYPCRPTTSTPITTHQLYLGPQAFQNPVSCLSFLLQEESRVRVEGNRGEEEGEQG